ncbi:MAG: elongation factor Ts [Flavobacteriales bacterium]|nr:elongation factor Ts [Bacteroidota bacterium]MCB9240972.1 elongation factor Ts [Flavobacteriales bacterium]
MAITAAAVNELRKMTGAGMMDCKKALQETNGDFEAAIDFLRKKGQKISAKRADRDATEGAVIAKSNADSTYGVIVRLSCETDFVAKNEDFVNLADQIADIALANQPANLDALKALMIDGLTISDRLTEEVGKIGEKIDITSFETVTGEAVVNYIHAGNRIGVLVALNQAANDQVVAAGKDVAMQIAAMNPVSVDENDVPEDVKARELEVGREQAREEGKPEEMLDKIAQGKLQKFYKENTLTKQSFVKDTNKTVAQMLNDVQSGLAVKAFSRVALG